MSERAGADVAITIGARASFEREVAGRFGVMPNFFCSASAAPGLIEELWAFAKSAFLDNPLPSLFKERLFVHLSRFCEVRYCIIRHVGFLIGKGWPAGDPKAGPQTIQQVITLLQRPLPDAKALAGVFDRLESHEQPMDIPVAGTQAEHDLFDALTVMFLEPVRWERAREALRRAVGDGRFELLTAFLAFVRTAHFWTETHPELAIEPDMLSVLEKHEMLARLLLDRSEAERVKAGEALRQTLAKLDDVEASLRLSRETLKVAMQSAGLFAWEIDRDTRYMKITGDPRSAFGFDVSPADHERFVHVHPEDLPYVRDACEAIFAGNAPCDLEHRVVNPTTGEVMWAQWTGRLVTETGRAKLVGITRNITSRKNADLKRNEVETALRESKEQFRWLASIVEFSDDAIVSKNLDGIITSWNKGAERLFGYLADEAVGKPVTILIPPERLDEETEILKRLRRGDRIEHYETVRRRKDGSLIDVSLTISPMKGAEGKVVGASKIARDITERKRSEAQISVLAREVEHRAKNLLANVGAMVQLSHADTPDGLKKAIAGRIAALASVHSLFAQSRGTGAELGSLVKQELAPYSRDERMRAQVGGPTVVLKPDLAQAIGVALHELATNAAKYGALSVPEGQVRVEWSRAADGRVVLRWTEAGGPPVNPPTRKGFGTHVMEVMIRSHERGDVRLDWHAEGLVCEIALPM
jgi:PAS domain S-box-containing protein